MSYVETRQVQVWLESSKYPVTSIRPEFESMAVNLIFAELAQRYDTTTWLSASTTPGLVLNLIAMQIAAFEYRAAVAQEAMEFSYADSLEMRIKGIVTAIATGAMPLPEEFPVDMTTALGSGPGFFPTDLSTELARDTPWAEGATSIYFTMQQEF